MLRRIRRWLSRWSSGAAASLTALRRKGKVPWHRSRSLRILLRNQIQSKNPSLLTMTLNTIKALKAVSVKPMSTKRTWGSMCHLPAESWTAAELVIIAQYFHLRAMAHLDSSQCLMMEAWLFSNQSGYRKVLSTRTKIICRSNQPSSLKRRMLRTKRISKWESREESLSTNCWSRWPSRRKQARRIEFKFILCYLIFTSLNMKTYI